MTRAGNSEAGVDSRVALVSGGSRGIGAAVVRRLAEDGYDVGFCYRSDAAAAAEVEKAVADVGRRALACAVDVRDAAEVRAWLRTVEQELGPVDAVVTSAGITRDAPVLLMKDEQWHDVLDTNLTGVYNVVRPIAFEMMKRRRGAIVTLSSVAGLRGNAAQSNYAASKAGVMAFSQTLARELGRYSIRVNCVAPGFIETEMTAAVKAEVLEQALARVPLGRAGHAEEVAELVSFLLSDRAAYITSGVFQIDGGLSL